MLNVIQHALTIAEFAFDYPALLEINRKIAVMRGRNSHLVKKSASLCLLSVCFFL
jgi:hypothetical protein